MEVTVVDPCTQERLHHYLTRSRNKPLPTRKVAAFDPANDHPPEVYAQEVLSGHEYWLNVQNVNEACGADALVIKLYNNYENCELAVHTDADSESEIESDEHHITFEMPGIAYQMKDYSRDLILDTYYGELMFTINTKPTGCKGCDTIWISVTYYECDREPVTKLIPLFLAGSELTTESEDDKSEESDDSGVSADTAVAQVEEDQDMDPPVIKKSKLSEVLQPQLAV